MVDNTSQPQLVPVSDLERNVALRDLEKRLVDRPGDRRTAKALITILDNYTPGEKGLGAYSDCQRLIGVQHSKKGWPNNLSDRVELVQYYKHWQSFLDSMNVTPPTPILQLFVGGAHTIHGEKALCNLRMSLFEKEEVISRICHDCYKVQILPLDLMALIQTYFIIRGLKLPRDNTRKCMVEVREDIPNPYKGYIYCESEDEAIFCLEAFQQALNTSGISNVYCGISHGCSEYGLKFPEFKYSNDGTHRSFERPASWDKIESRFYPAKKILKSDEAGFNKQGITIRDIIAFRTWINYAEIIGDDSCRVFIDQPTAKILEPFASRVRKQAQLRKVEMEKLRERLSSSA